MDNKEWMSSIEIVDEVLGDNNVDDRDCIWVAIRELSTGVLRNGEEE